MIRRVPVHNAVTNQHEILEGELVDDFRENSVYVDPNGKTYDASKGIQMRDLPNAPLVQLPRTTWYAFTPHPIEEDLAVVGYMIGPDGCVPIYERRNNGKNRGARTDDLRGTEPGKSRRNWRSRKAARAAGTLALSDDGDRGGGGAQP